MQRLAAILISLIALNASAEDSVKTRAGELKISTGPDEHPQLILNGKVLSQGSQSALYSFQDWNKFKFEVNGADVILVADGVSATCTTWFFVTIPTPPAKPTITKSFGMICGEDSPNITQKGDVITIKAPEDGKMKIYKYTNGQVR